MQPCKPDAHQSGLHLLLFFHQIHPRPNLTSAPFSVTVNSCTSALFLALKWHAINKLGRDEFQDMWDHPVTVTIPKRTYISVPMQIKHAGFVLRFHDIEWRGQYALHPFNIYDSARLFTSGMFDNFQRDYDTYGEPSFICCSFHSTKTLGIKRFWDPPYQDWDIEQGGCILHNDPAADAWLRKARFDGRTEGVSSKDDTFDMLGYHCYMNPSSARLGLELLKKLPRHNAPLPNDDYPDLSLAPIFR